MWKWIRGRQNEGKSQPLTVPNALTAKWTPRQYAPLVKEGYEKNVIVYRCVSMIARGVASLPWLLLQGNERLMTHPLLQCIQAPNQDASRASFLEELVTSFLLSGNGYVHLQRSESGEILRMQVLRPDRVRIIASEQGVEAYDYTVDGVGQRLSRSSVIHLKSTHPLNDWYGLSPIEVAAMAVDQHNAVSSHNLALLQNGGRPSGVFIWRNNDGWALTEEQKIMLREGMNQNYAGQGNAGRIMVLEGDVEWKEMGLSPKDMDFSEGKYLAAREIAQAFGVPAMLVGVPGDATYANYKEARFHLWEDTILPLLERIQDAFTRCVAVPLDENLAFGYDVEAVPALAPKREAAWRRVSNAGFLTESEKRAALGIKEVKENE